MQVKEEGFDRHPEQSSVSNLIDLTYPSELLIQRFKASSRRIDYLSKNHPGLFTREELDEKVRDFESYIQVDNEPAINNPSSIDFIKLDPRILIKTSDELKREEEPRLAKLGIINPHQAIITNPSLVLLSNEKIEEFCRFLTNIEIPGITTLNNNPKAINWLPEFYIQTISVLKSYQRGTAVKTERFFTDIPYIISTHPEIVLMDQKQIDNLIKSFTECDIKNPFKLLSHRPDLFIDGDKKIKFFLHHFSQEERKSIAILLEGDPSLIDMDPNQIRYRLVKEKESLSRLNIIDGIVSLYNSDGNNSNASEVTQDISIESLLAAFAIKFKPEDLNELFETARFLQKDSRFSPEDIKLIATSFVVTSRASFNNIATAYKDLNT